MNTPQPTLQDEPAFARPVSAVRAADPFIAVGSIVVAYYFFRTLPVSDLQLAMMLIAVVTVVMGFIEIYAAPWRKTPAPLLDTKTWLTESTIKWLGTMVMLAIVLFVWWLLPEYRRGLYRPVKQATAMLLPYVPIVSAIYILLTQKRLGIARDDDWYIGALLLGREKKLEWHRLRDAGLVWFVKGFFLPLNFCASVQTLGGFRGQESLAWTSNWVQAVTYIDSMLFSILVISITPGYLLSLRLLGTEIKKIDHSWFGWIVTLSCYPPLIKGVFIGWLNYHASPKGDVQSWSTLTESALPLQYAVGVAILLMTLMHLWGEAIFNLRASNLSNRGIITNGPFCFTKHPVYVSKCIGWLLLSMPFAQTASPLNNLRLTLLWCGVCVLYGLRGLAEEKLLSSDPTYDSYALWIDRHGIFRWAGKLCPPLSYAYRREQWKKEGQESKGCNATQEKQVET